MSSSLFRPLIDKIVSLRPHSNFRLPPRNSYKGKDMKSAHAQLQLSSKEFDVIVELLVSTLKDFKVGTDIIQEIGKLVEPLRGQIVSKK